MTILNGRKIHTTMKNVNKSWLEKILTLKKSLGNKIYKDFIKKESNL